MNDAPAVAPGTVQVWSDLLCPFAYVGLLRFYRACARLGLDDAVRVEHHSSPLELFNGPHPFTLTFVPAVIGCIALAIAFAIAFIPTDLQRRLSPFAERHGRFARLMQKLAQAPAATTAGVRDAFEHRRTRDTALRGAIQFWAIQIAVLWAAFHAFGSAPPLAVLVLAFFLGMLGNLLPMPGGVGGVEGGMIGAYVAFGVDSGLAVVAVLVYRAFTFWLPLLPGVIAYFRLRVTVDRWKSERAASATA